MVALVFCLCAISKSHTSTLVSGLQPFTLTQRTCMMLSTDYNIGNAGLTHWSHSLATAIPSITSRPNQTTPYAVCLSLPPFPQPTSRLVLFVWSGFPHLETAYFSPLPLDKLSMAPCIFLVSHCVHTLASIILSS